MNLPDETVKYLEHICSLKKEIDRTVMFQGLLSATYTPDEAENHQRSPYFQHVHLKIRLSGGYISGD